MKAIQFLNETGAFLITKRRRQGVQVLRHLQVHLYSCYIDESKE